MFNAGKCNECKKENPIYQCPSCNYLDFCESCFINVHKQQGKADHKFIDIPKKINKEEGKEEIKNRQLNKNNNQEIETPDLTMCKFHKGEVLKYFCKQCLMSACGDCTVDAKYHKKHDVIKISDMVEEVNNAVSANLELCKSQSVQLEELKKATKNCQNNIIQEINNYKESIINEFDKKILTALQKKKNEITQKLEKLDEPNLNYLKSIGNDVETMCNSLEVKRNFFENLKINQQEALLTYKDIITEGKVLSNYVNPIKQHTISLNYFKNKKIHTPEISYKKVEEAINTLNAFLEEGMVLEESRNSKLYLFSPPLFESEYLAKQNRAMKRIIELPKEVKTGDKDSKQILFRENKELISCFKDPATCNFYFMEGCDNVTKIMEYRNLEDFLSNKKGKNLNLEKGVDGNYIFAQYGFLFHTINKTSKIGKTNLKTLKLEDSFEIVEALNRNRAGFDRNGFTDISLFNDEATDTQFVMYEKKDSHRATISELIINPKLMLGKSIDLPFNMKHIGFCFVNDSLLYIGPYFNKPSISLIFNISNGKLLEINPIEINGVNSILHINYLSFESQLLIGGHPKIFTIPTSKWK